MQRSKIRNPPKETPCDTAFEQLTMLDLCGVTCPMAFVKARLFIDAQPNNKIVAVIYEDIPANESLVRSIQSLGHLVKDTRTIPSAKNPVACSPHANDHLVAHTLQSNIVTVQVKK